MYKNLSYAKKGLDLHIENLILKLCIENIGTYMRKLVFLTHHLL